VGSGRSESRGCRHEYIQQGGVEPDAPGVIIHTVYIYIYIYCIYEVYLYSQQPISSELSVQSVLWSHFLCLPMHWPLVQLNWSGGQRTGGGGGSCYCLPFNGAYSGVLIQFWKSVGTRVR